MNMRRLAAATATAAVAAAFLTGCASGTDGNDYDPRDYEVEPEPEREYPPVYDHGYGPTYDPHDPWTDEYAPEARVYPDESWTVKPYRSGGSTTRSPSPTCVYSPTMNYNWHDDMVCGGVRQYFLPGDDYITRDEIEAAAREWERRNN